MLQRAWNKEPCRSWFPWYLAFCLQLPLPKISAELFSKGRGFAEVVGGKSLDVPGYMGSFT